MSDDLLPCPFCGAAMQVRYALWSSEGDRDAVIHNVSGGTACPIEGAFCIDTFDNGVSVTEAWNRRAPSPELLALREAVTWQDISTAPRDGPAYLVWCPERFNIYLVASDHDDYWHVFGGRRLESETPTHWRPLPTPPTKDTNHD